jgi:DNA-binding NtrC family response regulator
MKPVIFYIDDEPHNLTVFEASMPDEWEICVFDNPMAAIDQLDIKKPWVVVSDQRMPSMTGVQFLEIVKKILPDSLRIIVTGYSDEELVVESVRKAQVFDYLKKPWDLNELISGLKRAIEYYVNASEAKKLQGPGYSRSKPCFRKKASREVLSSPATRCTSSTIICTLCNTSDAAYSTSYSAPSMSILRKSHLGIPSMI